MINWSKRDCWIAVFDILGFKNLIREADLEFPRALLTNRLSELLQHLDAEASTFGQIDHMIISDTIIIFTHDVKPQSYPSFLRLCKNLICRSITIELPLSGAISVGTTFTAEDQPILLGPAFVEGYEYCEDQDWIGLLLAPSAVKMLRSVGLEPLRHHFVNDNKIPLRKLSPDDVLAYRFQDGSSNVPNHLLMHLQQMKIFAPECAKAKYMRTIGFIERHHSWIDH